MKILVVDDAEDSRMLLSAMLEDDYQVSEADSGEHALALTQDDKPDLVLLDVSMPGMSGYEVCTRIRTNDDTKNIPVIFVSAMDTAEERLEGFEVGANDYLVKPVDSSALLEKVKAVLKHTAEFKQAKENANDAMKVAMEAMTVSSELGQVVEFIKGIQTIHTARKVGQSIIDILIQFGVTSAVRVVTDTPVFVGCEKNSVEANVLNRFSNHSERILSVGIHTIIRNEYIIMLLKDMPLDDENRYGRLKDHISVLMDIANGHLLAINARDEMVVQRKIFLKNIIDVAENQIESTSKRINLHSEHSQKIMQGMLSDLEGMLFGLGLEEDQEKALVALGHNASAKLVETEAETKELTKDLGVILESLYDMLQLEE